MLILGGSSALTTYDDCLTGSAFSRASDRAFDADERCRSGYSIITAYHDAASTRPLTSVCSFLLKKHDNPYANGILLHKYSSFLPEPANFLTHKFPPQADKGANPHHGRTSSCGLGGAHSHPTDDLV